MRSQLAKEISREEAAAYFGLDAKKKTILAFGGSLGARTINETIKNSYDLVAGRDDIQVLWQIGKLYADTYLDTPSAKLSQVKATVFIDRMDLAYALADVVIARAGAITISELALTGKPAILIPSPYVAEDHQTHNARSLEQMGAAVLITDGNAPSKAFPEALRLLDHPEELQKLEYNIMKLAKQNAADDIADIIIQLAKKESTF